MAEGGSAEDGASQDGPTKDHAAGPVTAAGGQAVARNLRLIPVHEIVSGSLVWLPILVLFTRARFDLDGALLLSGIYYLAVVVLEVPSGWMSDRLGRVPTLRLAAVCWIAAHLCFLVGDDRFWYIAAGQAFLAGGFASLSGTDVTLHYDSLEALDLAEEYRDRQGRLRSLGLVATATSSVFGGLIGWWLDLRAVFVVSLVLAIVQFGVTLRLVEPGSTHRAEMFHGQIRSCISYLADRYLGWIFFYGILMVTLEHVAFELMQPWLTEVLDRSADEVGATPLLSGAAFAVTSLVGAVAARSADPLARRFGAVATLIGLAGLSAVIVSSMALWVSAPVLVLFAFRSAQGAAAPVLIGSVVAPRVEQRHRATLLSLNSLAGRLGYGLILLAVSDVAADEVRRVLGWFSMISWMMVAVLVVTGVVVSRTDGAAAAPIVR